MKKLLFILFIIPIWCFGQTSVTPQFKKPASGNQDSLGYILPPSTSLKWLYNADYLKTNLLPKFDTNFRLSGDSVHLANSIHITDTVFAVGMRLGDTLIFSRRNYDALQKVDGRGIRGSFGTSGLDGGGAYLSTRTQQDSTHTRALYVPRNYTRPTYTDNGGITRHFISVVDNYSGATLDTAIHKLSVNYNVSYDIAKNPSANISSGTYDAFPVMTQMQSNNLVLIYRHSTSHAGAQGVIYMSKSTDGGATFSAPVAIYSEGGVDIRNYEIGVTPTNRLIVFFGRYDYTRSTWLNQGYIYSDDEGATWSSYQTISSNGHTNFSPFGQVIRIGAGKLMATWYGDGGPNNYAIYNITSSDNGATWSAPVTIAASATTIYTETALAYLDGGVIVGLVRTNDGPGGIFPHLHQIISTDNGVTWVDQGLISFTGNVTISPWLSTYIDGNGEKYVAAYYCDKTANKIKAIVGTYSGLIAGVSGWIVNSLVDVATTSTTNMGYPAVVNPNQTKKAIGAFFYETTPSTVATISFFNFTPYSYSNKFYSNVGLVASTSNEGTITPAALTAARTYTLPDKTGTFAMTSDLTGGTVTSVGLSLPSIFNVTGSPVTGTGTLTGTLANQSANTIWGNNTGSSAAPVFFTPGALTLGYGLTGTSFNVFGNTTAASDTTSSTGIVSKPRLSAALALYLRSNSFANPTATIGLTAVSGLAATPMRSDAAPALSQAIIPTWTNLHTFNAGLNANNIGIGNNPLSNVALYIQKTITNNSGSAHQILAQGTYDSGTTNAAVSFYAAPSTAAASYTLTSSYGFRFDGTTLGAGSSVFAQFGYYVHASMTQGTQNYGFYGNIPSGTNRWNFYANGTALNYFNGRTLFGTTTDDGSSQIQVNGSASVRHLIGNSSAPMIAAGPGAGTGAAVNLQVGATDLSGVITVSTGTSPTGSNAVIATVTFNTAYGAVPKVILTPSEATTSALTSATAAFVPCIAQTNGVTTTAFKLVSGTTALPGGVYFWTYQVIQ